jgi:excisionase family DNA binding protein
MPHKHKRTKRPSSKIDFLTVAEVASIMRVSKMTVYRLVHSGELPAIRVGRKFRIPEPAVHDYMRDIVIEDKAVPVGHRVGLLARSSARRPGESDQLHISPEVSLDTKVDVGALAHRVAEEGQIVYLTEHGQRLAAVVPVEVATELATLGDDERSELLTEIADALAARRALESIASGEPVIPWEDVKSRLEL